MRLRQMKMSVVRLDWPVGCVGIWGQQGQEGALCWLKTSGYPGNRKPLVRFTGQ